MTEIGDRIRRHGVKIAISGVLLGSILGSIFQPIGKISKIAKGLVTQAEIQEVNNSFIKMFDNLKNIRIPVVKSNEYEPILKGLEFDLKKVEETLEDAYKSKNKKDYSTARSKFWEAALILNGIERTRIPEIEKFTDEKGTPLFSDEDLKPFKDFVARTKLAAVREHDDLGTLQMPYGELKK